MAKAKKTETAPVVQTPTLNLALLQQIAAATAVTPGYLRVANADAVALGSLVEANPSEPYGTPDLPAVRVSAAGTEYLAKQASPTGGAFPAFPGPAGIPAAASAAAAPAAPAATPAKQTFAVATFAMPEAQKRFGGGGGARPEVYPFSTLEIGQAFFIPATAEVPNPEKKYATTTASANQRFSEEDPTAAKRKNRKGEEVSGKKQLRKFAIRRIADGAAFGPQFAGKPGAAIGRMPL